VPKTMQYTNQTCAAETDDANEQTDGAKATSHEAHTLVQASELRTTKEYPPHPNYSVGHAEHELLCCVPEIRFRGCKANQTNNFII
jgi:hypothetical protein